MTTRTKVELWNDAHCLRCRLRFSFIRASVQTKEGRVCLVCLVEEEKRATVKK